MAAKRKYKHTFRVPKDESLPLKYWQATLELKPALNGDRRRKAIRSKNRDKAEAMYEAALKDRDASGGDLPTRSLTLEQWVNEWFTDIAVHTVRPKTAMAYKSLIANHIIPTLGSVRLHLLSPSDVRQLNAAMAAKGLSRSTALQAHRILGAAIAQAHRDGKVARNVVALTPAPRRPRQELPALSLDEAITVLAEATSDPLGSLWWAVLLTAQRQGELLGLEIDRVGDVLDISWQLQRITWQHGCDPFCGRKRGADCRARRLIVPADWEHRHLVGGLWLSRPKTSAGWRVIPLVEPLASIIQRHIAATADQPNPHNLVWHTPAGAPIDPKDMTRAWHELLARAGVKDVKLHGGRHTTIDLLYDLGVPEDIIVAIVGHSTREQSRGYRTRVNMGRLTSAMQQLSELLNPLVDAHSDTPAAIDQ